MRAWPLRLVLSVLSALAGCTVFTGMNCEEPPQLLFPDAPFPLTALNSPFDDWNCGAPWDTWNTDGSFLFSSNRKTAGGAFDLNPTAVRFSNDKGFRADTASPSAGTVRLAARINTPDDELGPTFFSASGREGRHEPRALVFSRGKGGDHDLIALIPEDPSPYDSNLLYSRAGLIEVSLDPLNTPADEGYATWDEETGTILFHSNRDGRYSLYQAVLPERDGGIAAWLRHPDTAGVRISRVAELASDGQERCPFLLGNTLYFISDRAGGQGGFDIYRSRWNGGAWSAAENLGARVNSPDNEYRPAAFSLYADGEGALFFSSDRPGGKGGYDLYTVSAAPAR